MNATIEQKAEWLAATHLISPKTITIRDTTTGDAYVIDAATPCIPPDDWNDQGVDLDPDFEDAHEVEDLEIGETAYVRSDDESECEPRKVVWWHATRIA